MSRQRDMERAIKELRFTTTDATDARIRQHLSAARLRGDRDHSGLKHSTLRETIRTLVMSTKTRYAAAAIIAVAAVLALSLTINGGGNIAFAEVIENVEGVRTVTWRQTLGFGEKTITWECQVIGSGRARATADGLETIADLAKGEVLQLDHTLKLASVKDTTLGESFEHDMNDFVGGLTSLKNEAVEDLGEREIDGKPAYGFRVTQTAEGNEKYDGTISKVDVTKDVWVGKESGLPVLIEATIPVPGLKSGAKLTMTDIVYDVDLDEADLSVEPPEGYRIVDPGEIQRKM